MVQHAGADDVFKAPAEFARALHGKLPHLQVVEAVLVLQGLGKRDTFCADVDSDYLGARPAQRVMGRLGGAATRNEYGPVVTIGFVRPEEMEIGASARVIPEFAIGLQVIHWRWVGMTLVKVGHLAGNGGAGRLGNFLVAHAALEKDQTGPCLGWSGRGAGARAGRAPLCFRCP